MKTSLRGICAMLAEEAIVLSAYDDGTGTLTIGAGHTAAAGAPKPSSGMKISLTEAINIFRADLIKFERGVEGAVKVPLSQNQFDALVSWHFNTGAISTATLTQKLNARDAAGAAEEFARWNKSKGRVLDGLVARRARETAVFRDADYGEPVVRVLESKNGHEDHFSSAQIEALFGNTGAPAPEEDQSTEEILANPASRLLPANRPKQSDAVTRATYTKFIDLIPQDRRKDAVALVAVRGYYLQTMGNESTNDRGIYDDAIFVIEPQNVHNFNGNTDPGKFSRGIARLKSRQAVRYVPGLHGFSSKNGPYPAFRQDSNVTVIRDETGDDTDSEAKRFWINLHRGGNTTTSSLGCQTVPPHQWNEFKNLVDGLLKKYGQDTFYYLLVEREDVPEEENAMPVGTQQSVATATVPQGMTALEKELADLEARRKQINDALEARAKLDPLTSSSDPKLTPINGALGSTIGNALDGRKTLIGVVGMLLTTVLPIFFPQLAPIATALTPAVDTATSTTATVPVGAVPQQIITAAFPAFATLTGWGVLGKVEKWVRALRSGLANK